MQTIGVEEDAPLSNSLHWPYKVRY